MKLLSAQASYSGLSQTEITSPRARRVRRIGWTTFFLAGFVFFTFIKFPKERISEWILTQVNDQLRVSGMTLTSQSSDLLLGLGVTLKLTDARLGSIGSSSAIHFDEARFTPSLFSLLLGKPGGNLDLKSGNGMASVDFDVQSTSAQAPSAKIQFQVKALDLNKTGIFPFLLSSIFPKFPGSESMFQFHGGGILEGEGSIDGNLMALNSLQGAIKLGIKQIHVQEKTVFGFHIPNLAISQAKVDLSLTKGKATLRGIELGGQPSDDITGKISGDIQVGKELPGSATNLRAQFTLSQQVKDAVGIFLQNIDYLKKPDGSYSATLSGPWGSLVPSPDAK